MPYEYLEKMAKILKSKAMKLSLIRLKHVRKTGTYLNSTLYSNESIIEKLMGKIIKVLLSSIIKP